MIALIFSMLIADPKPLTDAMQLKHDKQELAMSVKLHEDQDAIDSIWRPSVQLKSDIRAARRCYVQFHLYKVDGCEDEFKKVDEDLNRIVE
jgi:hypothetical protein